MGKTSHLLKKIGDIKGTFHTRMGMINDRKSKDLIEAEEIEMARIQRRTIQQNIHDPDNHVDLITHLKPDIWNAKSSGS